MVLNFMQRTSSSPGLSIVRVGEGGTDATAASPARTFYVDDLVISATRVGCAN